MRSGLWKDQGQWVHDYADPVVIHSFFAQWDASADDAIAVLALQ